MRNVTSKDGTSIAFDQSGQGPALILVVGAFNDRSTSAPLTQLLDQHFTVFNYDRRGRGDSGDTVPYAVEREIEDLGALIAQADGSAYVFGYSSGARLALAAAAHGLAITKLALYEPAPVGPTDDLVTQLTRLIALGRRGEAVEFFQTQVVRIPVEIVSQLRNAPFRPALERMAHTLVYEMTILSDRTLPANRLASITIPALILDGADSPELLHQAAQSLADVLPNACRRTLADQTHDIVAPVVAPLVVEFLSAGVVGV